MAVVDDIDPSIKSIVIFNDVGGEGGDYLDSDFSLLILRTTISPPSGSPA